MRYVGTRGAEGCSFADMLLGGLAADGGLLMPERWPRFAPGEIAAFSGAPYAEVARQILSPFVGAAIPDDELGADIVGAYAAFDAGDVAPLVEIGPDLYLLELFHGPTLAFKDIAMQLLGRLFARMLRLRGARATVLAATSGDTGSAAIAALGGLPGIDVFVLHPKGRVSEVQRRQMTTVAFGNVHNIAIEGSFDDAQSLVKTLFAERDFAAAQNLTAVNSINFMRIAAQSVYYFTAAARFREPPAFVVPTGNFGDVFAGEAAMRMGLPVGRLIIATNANDIMARAIGDGVYAAGSTRPTLSPSMDIQVASNFERALYEASRRDIVWIGEAMREFGSMRRLAIPAPVLTALRSRYDAFAVDDEETLATMGAVASRTGRLIDPHTAVGVAAAKKAQSGLRGPIIVLSTAHPAKFPDAVQRATGRVPPLPPSLADLYEREERISILPLDAAALRSFITARLSAP